jgi:hypothetical protein
LHFKKLLVRFFLEILLGHNALAGAEMREIDDILVLGLKAKHDLDRTVTKDHAALLME